ncbi:m-phase inducer phosphatase [Tieghemiomyces parasiticus]|uniref:M-phase inducer phosphatase n=1 Tax=Tieghemiomyces parasiticus TaxID=78921 RepID=A0A9W8DJ26_9FUNG|nr:m-phase inducer phosphatase [Tieghemiomyces parasiticus]
MSSPCASSAAAPFLTAEAMSPLSALVSQPALALPSPVSNLTNNLNSKLFLNRSPRKTPRRSLIDCLTGAHDGDLASEAFTKRQRLTPAENNRNDSYFSLMAPVPLSLPSTATPTPAEAAALLPPRPNLQARKPPMSRALARCRPTHRVTDLPIAQYSLKRAMTMHNLPSPVEPPSPGLQLSLPAPSSLDAPVSPLRRVSHRSQSYSEPLEDAPCPDSPLSPTCAPTTLQRSRSFSTTLSAPVPAPVAPAAEYGCQILPCLSATRDPLKRITVDTMVKVMHGEFRDRYDELLIVDCRFPYEYSGGHIQGAINVSTPDDLDAHFLAQPPALDCPKRRLVIFHCEYSLHRAPNMAMSLRNRDRQLNAMSYPQLCYPEVYVLQGGYRNFYVGNKALCYPQNYVEMNDNDHRDDCRSRMATFKRGFKRSKSYTEGFPAMLLAASSGPSLQLGVEGCADLTGSPAGSRGPQPAQRSGSWA